MGAILKNKISKINGYILLKSGKVYDPFIGLNGVNDILIKDGIIIEISKNISSKTSYKVINCNENGGQTVYHLHLHLISVLEHM